MIDPIDSPFSSPEDKFTNGHIFNSSFEPLKDDLNNAESLLMKDLLFSGLLTCENMPAFPYSAPTWSTSDEVLVYQKSLSDEQCSLRADEDSFFSFKFDAPQSADVPSTIVAKGQKHAKPPLIKTSVLPSTMNADINYSDDILEQLLSSASSSYISPLKSSRPENAHSFDSIRHLLLSLSDSTPLLTPMALTPDIYTSSRLYTSSDASEIMNTPIQERFTPFDDLITSKMDKITLLCLHCPKRFTKQSSYDAHLLLHSSDRPFTCLFCPTTFMTKSSLRRHVRSLHGQERKFECTFGCGKRFARGDALKRHLKEKVQGVCAALRKEKKLHCFE